MYRNDLTDEHYALIAPELPTNERKTGHPWNAHRPIINDIFWRLHIGSPWPDIPNTMANGRLSMYNSFDSTRAAFGRKFGRSSTHPVPWSNYNRSTMKMPHSISSMRLPTSNSTSAHICCQLRNRLVDVDVGEQKLFASYPCSAAVASKLQRRCVIPTVNCHLMS
jgi:hypothetical protein